MTDRMLGAIEQAMTDFECKGIQWSAKTLTDRGRGAQETRYGADFMGVLRIDLPNYSVAKGFLAQAKLVRGKSVGNLKELRKQCEQMLELSPASFLFLYGSKGVRVVPAIAACAAEVSPLELYSRSAQRFFEEHLQCFIGDRAIASATPDTLKGLAAQASARSAIILTATAAEKDR